MVNKTSTNRYVFNKLSRHVQKIRIQKYLTQSIVFSTIVLQHLFTDERLLKSMTIDCASTLANASSGN